MSEDIDDIKESVKAAVKERIKNPFFGTFVLAWCVANWEALAIFIRDDSPVMWKIKLIKGEYLTIQSTLWIPGITALAMSIAYPWLDWLLREARSIPAYLIERSELRRELVLLQLRKRVSGTESDEDLLKSIRTPHARSVLDKFTSPSKLISERKIQHLCDEIEHIEKSLAGLLKNPKKSTAQEDGLKQSRDELKAELTTLLTRYRMKFA